MDNPADCLDRREALRWYEGIQLDAMADGGLPRWRAAEAWLGRNDLFYLLVRLLRRDDLDKDWLFDRCREVQAEPDGCLDLWAREHGKSSIITFGKTVQDVLCDPETTVGIFSHTRPIAKSFLTVIKREFEDNEVLKSIYPEILWQNPSKQSPKWSEDGGLIVKRKGNPKESTIEAWGLVDGQPTGRHFKLRVYDDVVTKESVSSPEMVKKTTDAWDLSQNLGMVGGSVRYIGTRYSLFDTYAEILNRGAAKARIYPATHNGRFDGRPVLFTPAIWATKLRDSSRAILAAQHLQNPMADEDATFRTEWLRSYEVRPRTLNVYIMADPSRGRSATSDNTAIAVIGISSNGAKFFLDGVCHRMTLSQRWVALRNLYQKWSRARGVAHIGVGYERYGAQSDDEYFDERMRLEKIRFPIQELNWTRDGAESKKDRVERLEPDFRNSRFFLPLPIIRNGKPCVWSIDQEAESKSYHEILYRDLRGPTSAQMDAIEGGSADLLAKAIKAVDQEGRVYDVTQHMMDEYNYFPFGRFDDLIDVCSRIYDMDARGPAYVAPGSTEPRAFFDS